MTYTVPDAGEATGFEKDTPCSEGIYNLVEFDKKTGNCNTYIYNKYLCQALCHREMNLEIQIFIGFGI